MIILVGFYRPTVLWPLCDIVLDFFFSLAGWRRDPRCGSVVAS